MKSLYNQLRYIKTNLLALDAKEEDQVVYGYTILEAIKNDPIEVKTAADNLIDCLAKDKTISWELANNCYLDTTNSRIVYKEEYIEIRPEDKVIV